MLNGSAAINLNLGVALESGGGSASLVVDCILVVGTSGILHVQALEVVLGSGGGLVDSIADAFRDLVALLHSESDLHDLVLNIFLEAAKHLGHIETLPPLLAGDDSLALLILNIGARLLLEGSAHGLGVGLAMVTLGIVDGGAAGLLRLTVGIPTSSSHDSIVDGGGTGQGENASEDEDLHDETRSVD